MGGGEREGELGGLTADAFAAEQWRLCWSDVGQAGARTGLHKFGPVRQAEDFWMRSREAHLKCPQLVDFFPNGAAWNLCSCIILVSMVLTGTAGTVCRG